MGWGAILLALGLSVPAALRAAEVSGVRRAMGAPLSVRLYGHGDLKPVLDAVFARVERLDAELSSFKPGSDVVRMSAAAPRWVSVSGGTMDCLKVSLEAARATGGAFNPLVGPIMKARGRLPLLGVAGSTDPALLDLAGLELNPSSGTARLAVRGMALDLGGIGKGFALREAEAVVRGKVDGALFDFGGQLHFYGKRPGTGVWPAAVADPRTNNLVWAGTLDAGSLSTSAQTEKPGHIVDPRRPGAPAAAAHVSATVWDRDPARADALSTAFFVMSGREIDEAVKRLGACAYVIDAKARGGRGDCAFAR